MNFESEISRIDVYKETNKSGYEVTYPYFYADITFDGDTKINKGEVLFNVKMEIIGDLDANNGIDLFDHYYIVEDLEQEKLTCCKWEVFERKVVGILNISGLFIYCSGGSYTNIFYIRKFKPVSFNNLL